MRKLYGTALLGLAVLLAMGLSACGGSDSDSSSTTTTAAKSASPVLGRTCTTPGAKGKTASGEPVVCGQGPGGGPNQWISTGTTPPSSTVPPTTAAQSSTATLGATCPTPGAKSKTATGEPVECGQGPGGGPNQWISTGTTPPSSTTAAQTPSNAAANGASCTTQGATAKDQATGDSLVCGQPPGGGGLIWHNP